MLDKVNHKEYELSYFFAIHNATYRFCEINRKIVLVIVKILL